MENEINSNIEKHEPKTDTKLKIFLILAIIITIPCFIFLGWYLNSVLASNKCSDKCNITSNISGSDTQPIEPRSTEPDFKDSYFNDTIFMITKSEPYRIVGITVSRSGRNQKFLQNTRVSYFDGKNWTRNLGAKKTNTSEITSDDITKSWDITYDNTKVLKQNVSGQLEWGGHIISFKTDELSNNMGVRSLPEYTKFISNGSGTLSIDANATESVNVAYLRIYSNDSSKVLLDDYSEKFNTNWLLFWDSNNEFYHVDKTEVLGNIPGYTSHSIAFEIPSIGVVHRTFDLITNSDNKAKPSKITYTLNNPINKKIQINAVNAYQQYPALNYPWLIGLAKGNVELANGTKVNGVGIYEYINN